MRKIFSFALATLFGATILAGVAHAAITSAPQNLRVHSGNSMYIPFYLAGDDAVAGINGQLNFNPNYFSNPRIEPGAGAYQFNFLGNEVEPGLYRFVIYADPTRAMTFSLPITYFVLEVDSGIAVGTTTDLTYAISAAGTPDGVSIADVTFANVHVSINAAGASDWTFYE